MATSSERGRRRAPPADARRRSRSIGVRGGVRAKPEGTRVLIVLALAAAALLGACVVEVEGAPCAAPGASSDCPGGQACGNDLRCSARALGCAGSRCTPGAGGECLDPTGATSGVDRARRCVGDDPVCGTWIVEPCAPGGFTCAVRPGFGARCACPPTASRELAVRPDGSPAAAPPFATGATSPGACAFLRLGDALAAATALAADPSSVVTVTSGGVASGATRTFSAAAGETFPLVIPARVTVRSEGGGGAHEVLFDGEGAPTAVELHGDGALAGFTVRNGGGDQHRSAVDLRCAGGAAPARLSSVTLDGRGAGGAHLGHGIVATSTCGLVAQDVVVREMSVAAVVVDFAAGLPTVAFTGGSITGSGDGIVVGNGRLVLDATHVTSNSGMGVRGNAIRRGAPGDHPRVQGGGERRHRDRAH